ncbi:MAG: low molecular weight phosphotyrosine protein phosphatase [Clostridia bacterium]|nr:low molecular weight phosphotyrosine protein phosphatase [Clostridia bacterium]
MVKILFICHGNICRSPMAEFVFADMIRRRDVAGRFSVASCATSTEEIIRGIGNPVYPPAKRELARHGISCDGKRAVQLKKSDYDRYDYLVCMDSNNVRNALRILGGDPDGKVTKLLYHAGRDGDVADPWYSGDFETAYRDIEEGCAALLEKLL